MVFFLPTHNYESHSGPLCATLKDMKNEVMPLIGLATPSAI